MSSYSELQQYLSGRALLLSEIPFPLETIEKHLKQGNITTTPALTTKKCLRCGNNNPRLFATYPCFICQKDCLYCRNCVMMGRISSCINLYHWSGSELQWKATQCAWQGQLSQQQKTASLQIMSAIHNHQDLLCWSVTGSGKTEMIFSGIELALQQGKRICLASPRVDVILELAPRVKTAFPETSIAVLYGDSEEKYHCAQLILATTHQLMRFTHAFEVMIVDEVDAFPYSIDSSLQYAVEKAKKLPASTIYLTATPSKEWQKGFFSGKNAGVHLPARFHRHPLPVPKAKWCGNWRRILDKAKLPPTLQKRLQQQKQPFLIFFPNIELMEKALPLFQNFIPNLLSVHAKDPDRKEKIILLRQQEIPGLLTTTILERGITIKGLDVIVVGAEDRIFTEAALVQIAGRAGRSKDFPQGKVIFYHYGKTKEIENAIKHIKQNNQLAFKQKLIDYL